MLFHQLFESESSTYTYLLADPQSRQAVIIDPVLDKLERDLQWIREMDLSLQVIIDTHVHADHITAADALRKQTGAQTAASRHAGLSCVDRALAEGDLISFGSYRLKVLETPGHTPCSLSLVAPDRVFTGDTLLIRGCGRTDFQNGSASALYRSVRNKLFALPESTLVYPGHDYRGLSCSSIGLERKWNPRLKDGTSEEAFLSIMSSLNLAQPKRIHEAVPANMACGRKPDAVS